MTTGAILIGSMLLETLPNREPLRLHESVICFNLGYDVWRRRRRVVENDARHPGASLDRAGAQWCGGHRQDSSRSNHPPFPSRGKLPLPENLSEGIKSIAILLLPEWSIRLIIPRLQFIRTVSIVAVNEEHD